MLCVYMCVCLSVCVYVCVCLYVVIVCVCVCAYVYAHEQMSVYEYDTRVSLLFVFLSHMSIRCISMCQPIHVSICVSCVYTCVYLVYIHVSTNTRVYLC